MRRFCVISSLFMSALAYQGDNKSMQSVINALGDSHSPDNFSITSLVSSATSTLTGTPSSTSTTSTDSSATTTTVQEPAKQYDETTISEPQLHFACTGVTGFSGLERLNDYRDLYCKYKIYNSGGELLFSGGDRADAIENNGKSQPVTFTPTRIYSVDIVNYTLNDIFVSFEIWDREASELKDSVLGVSALIQDGDNMCYGTRLSMVTAANGWKGDGSLSNETGFFTKSIPVYTKCAGGTALANHVINVAMKIVPKVVQRQEKVVATVLSDVLTTSGVKDSLSVHISTGVISMLVLILAIFRI